MRPLSPPLAAAVVFFTSAAVLVLEILAVRLLAPYVGLTLETYTTVIGVVLAGIALGSWLGGRLADQHDPRALLGPLLVVGGLLAAATVPLVRALGEATQGTAAEGIILLGLLGFLPPAAVLSAVTPVVIKLTLRDLDETGDVVGRLSAIGTAGALTGTFLTGFVLVSALPNAPIIIGIGVALALAGCLLGRSRRLLIGTLAAGLFLAGAATAIGRSCEVESAYFCARVVVDPTDDSGRILLLDDLRHAYVDLDDPRRLELRYVRIIGDALDAKRPGPPGAAARAAPRRRRLHPAAVPRGHAAGLDQHGPRGRRRGRRPRAREAPLRTSDALRVRTGDARVLPARRAVGVHDVLVGDAFGSLAVPWHLATREFLEDVRRVLKPDGLVALNLIDRGPLRFARAEVATLLRVFRHVAVVGDTREGGNLILLASQRPIRTPAPSRTENEEVLTGARCDASPATPRS
jgi:hypothetical protein